MKPIIVVLAATMALGSMQACSMIPRGSLRLDGRVNCPALSTHGGRVYLQLSVVTTDPGRPERKPLNLSVVLDRSGSMGEAEKMSHAKASLHSLIDLLRPEDLFSLVIYDDVVDVLSPSSPVGRRKNDLHRLVDEVSPRGWTNLGGGMIEGFRQAGRNIRREYVNRVILLSDGLANQGITNPEQLAAIAHQERMKGISLTTIGVGLDYNENLMVGLADQGGGNYYFIESARNLSSVLRKEFDQLSTVLAQNVTIELELGSHVTLRDIIGFTYHRDGTKIQVPIGDLYANETRELMAEVDVPEGTGSLTVARGRLVWDVASGGEQSSSTFTSDVRYVHDQASVDRERDWGLEAKGDVAASTRKVAQALEALDAGRREEAAQTLESARRDIAASPVMMQSGAAGSVMKEQEARLKSYTDSLSQDQKDARKTKKSIQFDNYQVQRQK